MMITGIDSTNGVSEPNIPSPAKTQELGLGRDAFMELMLAQLRNQDPLEPMGNADFLAQLAQFNALEEMKQLNESFSTLMQSQQMLQASVLIGKQVSGLGSDEQTVSGVVSAVRTFGDEITLYVGNAPIPLTSVHSVEEAPADVS